MRFRLRTLLIVSALGPPALALFLKHRFLLFLSYLAVSATVATYFLVKNHLDVQRYRREWWQRKLGTKPPDEN